LTGKDLRSELYLKLIFPLTHGLFPFLAVCRNRNQEASRKP
jgi:hypothetical protein